MLNAQFTGSKLTRHGSMSNTNIGDTDYEEVHSTINRSPQRHKTPAGVPVHSSRQVTLRIACVQMGQFWKSQTDDNVPCSFGA